MEATTCQMEGQGTIASPTLDEAIARLLVPPIRSTSDPSTLASTSSPSSSSNSSPPHEVVEVAAEVEAGRFPGLVAVRRDVHRRPEVGFKEVRTHDLLRSLLQSPAAGSIPASAIRDCAGTGLVVDLQGRSDTPAPPGAPSMIALRADIDALPMLEANSDLPYRSINEGAAHMCGHDGHLTALLGAAILLQRKLDVIPKTQTVRLFFQPAEEGPGGAPVMIAEGCLDGVDEVYGMHNWPALPLGTLSTKPGPVMAHTSRFTVKIIGRGSHGSQPHTALDPIVAAAQVISALQTIVARNISYEERVVLSVCWIKGGETFNVLPDSVSFGGTIRDLSPVIYEKISQRFHEIVNGTCKALGVTCEIELQSRYPVLVNTEKETDHVVKVAKRFFGSDSKVSSDTLPMLGAEDFAYFLEKRPGCFFFLGTKQEGKKSAMCHSTDYDFNDALLPLAVAFWIRLVKTG